ncbi:hypothetical protein G0D98_22765 [Pseudomonas savastanoi pv. phaseolicola]|uniref:Uncharacterized protein n=1 Tax=Pseudomonas coronafaciens pv. coronafaciens TaxID=235275 RepID=A0AAE6UMA4_9PSED|nr:MULTISPECIES: ABC-three component system middle component 4 [Pseudomonas syringae group]MBN3471255.1 hypothetical protein [Pseudomonas savastanoi pv. phaseolicola]MBN3478268.1 hypothetical protein [Pseudomonas savastanoi pv. phaseolicola]QGT82814.1 hypothetical protein GMO17_17400 [Pseudomonas coronafaciens pv. coronafaciens]
MNQSLPYMVIDDNFDLNYGLVALVLYKLGLSPKNNAVLDFERLQIFLYLTKYPSKINRMLQLAGKKYAAINSRYIYTIESLSTNVDVLFDRAKLKHLLRHLAVRGMLACDKTSDPKSVKYSLTPEGVRFAEELLKRSDGEVHAPVDFLASPPNSDNYFSAVLDVIESLAPLQSQSLSKLNAHLNSIFKGDFN